MRLLYVEDDRLNTMLFEAACDAAGGIELVCAASGAEAMDCIAGWEPELLVIDLHLPDTDGYRLLPTLRTAMGRPQLPALLCTAEHEDDVRQQALEAGFDGCIDKPVDPDSIRRLRVDGGAR